MPEIEIIAATKTLQQQPLSAIARKKRVAAYARVSTEQDEQQSSYEAQVDFYIRHIKSNPDREFVEVFADRGITGTNTKNRENFNRMIDLALSGGIDIILTKSISRFARNTVDTLQTVRELKAVGVEVRFEKENLHTFDPKCEMMLTIMSSLAQEESRSISENVRWGKQKSMRDGKVSLAYSRFLGYKKGSDGRPEIVEEEAAIIRKIYDLFLSGKTINEIAAILTNMGVLTPAGRTKWSVSTVRSILSNEKYKGEALLQKTFTVDYLTKEVRKNNGEVPSVRVRNSHEPIIEPEVFDRVQSMLATSAKRRAKVRRSSHSPENLSAVIAVVFMATKSGGCAVQANAITSGTVTTSTTAIGPASLPDSGMRKSKRRLRKCCKSAVIQIPSIPMRSGTSWSSPSRSAGAAT